MPKNKKCALILTTVSDFLDKFEKQDIKILQDMGYCIHYATNVYDPNYHFDETVMADLDVKVHHIDIGRSPYVLKHNLKAYFQLVKLIAEYNIQVIHCHTPVGGVLGRLVGKKFEKNGIKVIYTAHGFHFYKGAPALNNTLYYGVEKMLAVYTDVLITINEEDYLNAGRFCLKAGGGIYRIPGVGLDTRKFVPISQREKNERRKKIGIRDDVFLLLSVGELNQNKNQEIVIRALARMKNYNGNNFRIKYGICGEGFYKDYFQRLISQLELEDTVILYGYQKDVRDILGCADAMVFPSRREGLGMAALEALSMGIPVIASDNRGTREYMKHMENGYVCQWDNAASITEGIIYLRDQNLQKQKEMKERCRMTVKDFSLSRSKSVMQEIYKRHLVL